MRSERDEIRKVKKKIYLSLGTRSDKDICYVGCAENPPTLWRDHSGLAYPLWLRQNRVSVGTASEIPWEKDFLWQVYWFWLTRNAKEMLDLRRGLRRHCSSVPTFSQFMWIQCPVPLQSQKTQQTMHSAGFGFHSSLLNMWRFCEGHANYQSSMEQPRHHVLTCSGALYKLQYFNAVWSNTPSQS